MTFTRAQRKAGHLTVGTQEVDKFVAMVIFQLSSFGIHAVLVQCFMFSLMLFLVMIFISINMGQPVMWLERWGSCGDTSCFFCCSTQMMQIGNAFGSAFGGLKRFTLVSLMYWICWAGFLGTVFTSGSNFSISRACLDHSFTLAC